MIKTIQNCVTEISLNSEKQYKDPFNDIEIDVVFTGSDGEQRKVPAFWGGGNVWKVRYTSSVPGEVSFETVCSDPENPDLHGQKGRIPVVPYTGDNPLLKHGGLQAATNGRHLEHRDGTPFLWLGDTWWMGLTKRLDWPEGFKELTRDRVDKGFSVIQIVAGPLPDFDAEDATWHPQQANEAGWPWEENWARINPAFYDLADLRIEHLVDQGLVPCIVGMWGYYLSYMGIDRVKQHWRNLVARYGAYPVVWCLAGEVNMLTYSYKYRDDHERMAKDRKALEDGWTEAGEYVSQLDSFDNPITAHPSSPDSRSMVHDDSCLDLNMLQTGHGGYFALKNSVDRLIECRQKTPVMPTLNGEVNYEGIMGGSKDEIQRFLVWASILSGAAGHTYGAQGIWAMSSRDEPFVGSTSSWGDGFWQDVMHLPGSAHTGLVRKFLERYPWWQFEPRPITEAEKAGLEKSGREYPFAAGVPKVISIFYFAAGCMDTCFLGFQRGAFSDKGLIIQIEPETSYRAFYFNPRTGEEVVSYYGRYGATIELGDIETDENRIWEPPPKPTMEDWVLVLENPEALAAMREK